MRENGIASTNNCYLEAGVPKVSLPAVYVSSCTTSLDFRSLQVLHLVVEEVHDAPYSTGTAIATYTVEL